MSHDDASFVFGFLAGFTFAFALGIIVTWRIVSARAPACTPYSAVYEAPMPPSGATLHSNSAGVPFEVYGGTFWEIPGMNYEVDEPEAK